MVHSLTYDLYVNNGCIHMVFNLHSHLVLSRVATLCFTNEDNAVTLCVADANMCRIYGLALLQPSNLWPGFALQTSGRDHYSVQSHCEYYLIDELYHKWHNEVDCLSNSTSVGLL